MKIIEAEKGETMFHASKRACLESYQTGLECEVLHNGVSVTVYPGSLDKDIYEKLYYKQIVAKHDSRALA